MGCKSDHKNPFGFEVRKGIYCEEGGSRLDFGRMASFFGMQDSSAAPTDNNQPGRPHGEYPHYVL